MRYFKFTATTPYVGTTNTNYVAFEDNEVCEELLEEYAGDYAYENGESFEYLATGWGEGFIDEEEREEYYSECICDYEEITKEEFFENTSEWYS